MTTTDATLLLVDDDIGMVDTLADILSARGYEVVSASSGDAALVIVRRGGFDVALLDVRMPGLNGVETLKLMRALDPRIGVIMMTAFTRDELVEEARRSGAVAILSKPLDIEEVLGVLDTARAKHPPGPPA